VIRSERSFEHFSRGLELVRAIRACWKASDRIPIALLDRNDRINANCEQVVADFDLTYEEWHYWCRIANQN
jgi:hypothetical protein